MSGMARDPSERKIEDLEAGLAQQKRLVESLSQQVATLLDEVARLSKKPSRGRKRRKEREAKIAATAAAKAKATEHAPTAPARDEDDEDGPAAAGVPRRGPISEELERDTEAHELDDDVSCCHSPVLEARDPKILERKTLVPAHARVRHIELHRAECLCCGTMHTAQTPPMAMPNGSMTAMLIAFIVNGKCALHLPLKRIIEDLATRGLTMAKSTMSNVMRHAATLLIPVYDRIVAALFGSDLIHADGTGIKALTPGQKGSHRGQIAVYCNEVLTVYGYSENKDGEHMVRFLGVGEKGGYQGWLVADAASNMDQLYKDGSIRECGCWYHALDKFEKAAVSAPSIAREGIAWMGTLFDVERRAKAAGDSAVERLARRKRESIPLLRGFYQWMNATQHRFPPDEEIFKAIQYCRNHWGPLTRFMLDGQIPMTNNLAERELGVFGRGRKAWLFAGSDASGQWLAILHTITRTCQRLSIAPLEYLTWVLPKLSDLPVNRGRGHLNSLTPMAYSECAAAV